MNIYLKQNLIFLRKKAGKTQGEVAQALEIKRATYGSYEEGRANFPMRLVSQLSDLYLVPIEDILSKDLQKDLSKQKSTRAKLFYSKYISSEPRIKQAVKVLLNIQ